MPSAKEAWPSKKLAELVADDAPIVYGIVQAGPEQPGGVPYIKSSDVGGSISPSTLSLTSPEIAAKYKRSTVVPGDIVFSLRGNIGAISIVPNDLPSANLTQGTARIRPGENVDGPFLAYALCSSTLQTRIAVVGKGSTFREISLEELRRLEILTPTYPVQRTIAGILATWDEAIENIAAMRVAKIRLRDGVLQKLFGSLPKPKNHSKSKRVTFGTVFAERQDHNYGLGSDDVVTVGKYAIRKQSDHFTRSVASSDLSGYWTISPGDFVYDPMSAYYGALGRYTGTSDGIVSPAYRVLQLRDDVSPEFMVYVLKSHRVRFLLETRSSQGNKEGKRRLLQRDEFAAIDFVLPSEEEQRAFVDTVSHFEKDIQRTTALLNAVRQQKQGLMQKLLTGEWRLPC